MNLVDFAREKGVWLFQFRKLGVNTKEFLQERLPVIKPSQYIMFLPLDVSEFHYDAAQSVILCFDPPLHLICRGKAIDIQDSDYCYIPASKGAMIRRAAIIAITLTIMIAVGSWAYQCQAEYGAARVAQIMEGGYHTLEDLPGEYLAIESAPSEKEEQVRCLLCGLRFKRIHDKNLFTLYDEIMNDPNISRDIKKNVLTRAYHEAEWFGIDSLIMKYSEWDFR